MKWTRGHRSANVEDRRGRRGLQMGVGGTLVGIVLYLVLGQDILGVMSGGGPAGAPPPPEQDELVEFVSFTLDDIQGHWERTIDGYRPAKLVLFSDRVRSACGLQGAAVGPFYCPADEKAYIDLSFYRTLRERFGAPGDFAQAYVLAHEIGHHLQKLHGGDARLRAASEREANLASVRQELQADCLAGVWAHDAAKRGILELGDLEEGLRAAAAIGDDTLQRRAGAEVQPESWTHGSSEQRVQWLRKGYEAGKTGACDTSAVAIR